MLGSAMGGGFLNNSIETIRQAVEDKFFSNLKLAQAVYQPINDDGTLTFTSGTGGHPAQASGAIIGNQAINTMVIGLAIELAPAIRVNAVAPTWTPTGLWRQLSEQELKVQTKQVADSTPLKRVASPTDVASAYVYLMTNHVITGQVINVDGGVSVS
ncbi:SDR family oxidoreductase [Sporolactobacillus kofuensis]|uniref:SDR family oxidoreductase n=1 Tax=Sporolactobacillus kofuensis TaxID=269672 RepID=A0ABW1WIZ1_9BACL|nr:SDR family oxidoreductase [Sporolactobacillus kofuensis]MCO7177074.1 SDR family oxidoreductase [Sporolactobacillus kofuensis]